MISMAVRIYTKKGFRSETYKGAVNFMLKKKKRFRPKRRENFLKYSNHSKTFFLRIFSYSFRRERLQREMKRLKEHSCNRDQRSQDESGACY